MNSESLSKPLENMPGAKLIYGQAYIVKDSLVQDQIIVMTGGKISTNTITLITDIWEDLLSANTKCSAKGKYFYWTVTMTDISNDDITYKVQIEAPQPSPDLFDNLKDKDIENGNSYVKYWANKIKVARENYEKSYAIQKKEVTLPGTKYISQTGEEIVLEDVTVKNNSLGDIENLLSIF